MTVDLALIAAAVLLVAVVVAVTGWLIDREPATPVLVDQLRRSLAVEIAVAVVATLGAQMAGREPRVQPAPNQIRLTRPGWLES